MVECIPAEQVRETQDPFEVEQDHLGRPVHFLINSPLQRARIMVIPLLEELAVRPSERRSSPLRSLSRQDPYTNSEAEFRMCKSCVSPRGLRLTAWYDNSLGTIGWEGEVDRSLS